MSTEVICALISAAGVVLSALVSVLISRNEIKKLKLSWSRDDDLSFSEDFNRACSCILNYIETPTDSYRRTALRQVLLLQSSAPAKIIDPLRKMNHALDSGDPKTAKQLLDELISIKQKF